MLRLSDGGVQAARADSYPEMMAQSPGDEPRGFIRTWVGGMLAHPMGDMLPTGLNTCAFSHFSRLANRRMAATALAIYLHEIDHDRRPKELADLVDGYLPAVPIDPFAADGRPIGYVLEPGRSRLYSVGQDGEDDGGREERGHFDHVFFLDAQPDCD